MKTQPIKVGDSVAGAKQWLQSTGHYTSDVPYARGQVTALVPVGKTATAGADRMGHA